MNLTTYRCWVTAGLDFWTLAFDAGAVMTMRATRVAGGGSGARDELRLMVSEKISAMIELYGKWMTGALGATALTGCQGVLDHYRGKVAANSHRLLLPG